MTTFKEQIFSNCANIMPILPIFYRFVYLFAFFDSIQFYVADEILLSDEVISLHCVQFSPNKYFLRLLKLSSLCVEELWSRSISPYNWNESAKQKLEITLIHQLYFTFELQKLKHFVSELLQLRS